MAVTVRVQYKAKLSLLQGVITAGGAAQLFQDGVLYLAQFKPDFSGPGVTTEQELRARQRDWLAEKLSVPVDELCLSADHPTVPDAVMTEQFVRHTDTHEVPTFREVAAYSRSTNPHHTTRKSTAYGR